jgi:hormone-sensitive lipase
MVYLRVWANELRVPIISVDYSLSPQAQAGQALAECVYAYTWVLANAARLGVDPTQIVVSGDSAGGMSRAHWRMPRFPHPRTHASACAG